jgi:hypothetical protein
MTKDTSKLKTFNQADFLDERIAHLEKERPDPPMLPFMRTQTNFIRRRQKAGLEKPWPNPCM